MRLPLMLVLLALAPAWAAAAGSEDPLTALAESNAKQAMSLYNSPRAAAYLIRLHALRDEVPDLNLLAQTYHDLIARRATDPLVRALAHFLRECRLTRLERSLDRQ